jgi:hypothetical protein
MLWRRRKTADSQQGPAQEPLMHSLEMELFQGLDIGGRFRLALGSPSTPCLSPSLLMDDLKVLPAF